MFELYYPDQDGKMTKIATFLTKEECLDKVAADNQTSYMIELEVNDDVLMVFSC